MGRGLSISADRCTLASADSPAVGGELRDVYKECIRELLKLSLLRGM
jgi:hypothetical protein